MLAEAGGRPEHIVRMTWYVVDRDEYVASLRELGRAYREVIGRHFPAMTAVEVSRLVEAAGEGRDRGDRDRAGLKVEGVGLEADSQDVAGGLWVGLRPDD